MKLVPKRARDEINSGDMVISSGIGGVYPAGLNIGRVSSIISREYESSLELELSFAADFSRLEYVFVIDEESENAAGARRGSASGEESEYD
jgi:rod shape-determining protein MreC